MWITCLLPLYCISSHLFSEAATKEKLPIEEVEVVLGTAVTLPCDLVPPEDDDSVALVIWYKDDDKTPIYSLDVRERDLRKGIHWADGDLEGRGQFSSDLYQAALTLADSRGSDSGLYKCRVDFKHSPTRNSLVNVTVIVPPEDIHMEDADGTLITTKTLGPLPEGTPLQLYCVSTGGSPTPRVSWWYNLTLLDDSFDVLPDGRVKNTLYIAKTERDHLHGVLTCQALNSPFVVPKTISVTIDLFLGPLDVRLLGDNLPMSAASEYEVACLSSGSRPPATLTWWKSGEPLHLPAREVSSIEGNMTTSTISLTPSREDHGAKLSCRATNPRVPNRALEASWTLDIHFVPEAEVELVSTENTTLVKEGMSILLECKVKSNPPATKIQWIHDGIAVQSNMDYQLFPNNSLGMLFVTRKNDGGYSCSAENPQGTAESADYHLDIKYIPKCRSQEQRLYGAAPMEEVNVSCETSGNPPATRFWWRYNSIVDGHQAENGFRTNGSGGVSTARVTLGQQGEVTVLCWAENQVGNQSVPCSFRVVLAGNPEAPTNCSVSASGESWVSITCEAGEDGGLPQTLVAEVTREGRLVANASRTGLAEFSVTGLEPGLTYSVTVRAVNAKGSSEVVTLLAATAGRLITERRTTDSQHNVADSTLLLGVISFMACVLVVCSVVGGVLIFRVFRRSPPERSQELKKVELITVTDSCNASDDEKNPDVIPCSNELTVVEVPGEESLAEPSSWGGQVVVAPGPVHAVNTRTVPCLQSWGPGWKGSCPNISQKHAETQTPKNVLESVV